MRTTIMTIEELLEQPGEYETTMSKAVKIAYRLGGLAREVTSRSDSEVQELLDHAVTFSPINFSEKAAREKL